MTKDIATVKAALEYFKHRVMVDDWNKPSREQHLEVIKAAARAYVETALSSPPAAPTPDNNGWMPIETAPSDGRMALVYRPLARNSTDEPVAVKRLIGGNHHCWECTVPAGESPYNPTDGSCHATHWQPLPLPPPPPALDKGE